MKKKRINLQPFKKGDFIAINYLTIQQNKLKENDFIGLCMKIKKKNVIKLKNKIKKEKINFGFFINSPIILKILKIRSLIKEKTHFSKF